LDVPELVVMVTGMDVGEPVGEGTVTVQVEGVGQSVGATCPPKRATIDPSELRRLVPDTATAWPATPVAGARDESTGAAAPAGAAAGPAVVDGVDVLDGEVVEGVVAVGAVAGAVAGTEAPVADDVGSAVPWEVSEPMRPPVTSTRATATMPMEITNRRSLRWRSSGLDLGGGGRPGEVGAPVTAVVPSGAVERARRAASAMASRAPELSSLDGRLLPGWRCGDRAEAGSLATNRPTWMLLPSMPS
jgi:hypothetical protein